MLLNIRGTNGSGKTTVYRKFIDEHRAEDLYGPMPREGTKKRYVKPIAFRLEGGAYCVGRYQAGCDGIHPHEVIEDLIRHYAALGHAVYENVLISGNRGRWEALAIELAAAGNPSCWAVLDTPFEECLRRIYERRARRKAEGWKHRNDTIQEGLVEAHYRRVHRSALEARAAGMDVRLLDHRIAYEQAHDILRSGGWESGAGRYLVPDDPALPYERPPDDGGFDRASVHAATGRRLATEGKGLPTQATVSVAPGGDRGTIEIAIEEGWDISAWE